MKKLFLLALITPMFAFAQSEQEHAQLVDKFVKYYNKRQTDSICALFPDERTTGVKCFWKGASTDGTYDMYGKITAYEYIGVEGPDSRKVTTYKVVFSKMGAKAMKFSVDESNKFVIFLLQPF